MENVMPDEKLEATYHYILSDMSDLIRTYGYAQVINDLDAMIASQVNLMTNNLNADGVPVIFEERN
jgi:hypothetical protein